MNYNLNIQTEEPAKKKSNLATVKSLVPTWSKKRKILLAASLAMIVSAALTLISPILIATRLTIMCKPGNITHSCILRNNTGGLYFDDDNRLCPVETDGDRGPRMLFTLRNAVFTKLQELPVDFFNQNRAGDLISRINNDTDKINQFFSQSLMQFLRFILIMIGAVFFGLDQSGAGSCFVIACRGDLDFYQNYFAVGETEESLNLKVPANLSSEFRKA
jgi:ATP-binding cassette subfamily B protein